MKKQVQVIMLPTKKDDTLLQIGKRTSHLDEGENNVGKLGLFAYININFFEPQHLYLTSNEEIKELPR